MEKGLSFNFRKGSFGKQVDYFLSLIFSASKIVSAVIVALCLLVLLYQGGKFLFAGHVSFEVPAFKEVKEALEASQTERAGSEDYTFLEEKREVEKRYGDTISKIVRDFGFSSGTYDVLVRDLIDIPAEYRSGFIYGLEDFLKEAKKYEDKHHRGLSLVKLTNWYREAFKQRLREAQLKKEAASAQRLYILASIGVTLVILLAFLIIPLLIKIEENTRGEKA